MERERLSWNSSHKEDYGGGRTAGSDTESHLQSTEVSRRALGLALHKEHQLRAVLTLVEGAGRNFLWPWSL